MSSTYDVILYGATGFTGRQTAAYFTEHAPADLRWAIAGRSAEKLERIAAQTSPTGVIVADSTDPASVDAMVQQTRVLLTTAGPFARYGGPVVDACVRFGVHYVDITGETPWVRGLIDMHHEKAAADGTRIIPLCGFDSVPSDLGTLLMVEHLRGEGVDPERVSGSFKLKGGLNGGTLDSAIAMADHRRQLGDPVLLNPEGRRTDEERKRSRDLRTVLWDEDRDTWLLPFVMAAINTRVVRRSNALFAEYDRPYGAEFTYHEAMEMRSRPKAVATAMGLGVVEKLLSKSWGRALLKKLGPNPGEGPSEATMDGGFFRLRLVATGADGRRFLGTMKAQGDPGNRVTVTILCEAALQLATDPESLPGEGRGGVLTPATGLGLALWTRLEAQGFEFSVAPL